MEPSPTLEETVERLEDWEKEFRQEYLEESGGEITFRTDDKLVKNLLTAAGDYNPIHFLEGLEASQETDLARENYQEFLDEVLEEEEGIGQPHWIEDRRQRDLEKYSGAVNPGMVYTTAAGLMTEDPIESIEVTWEDASWIGDQVKIAPKEKSPGYDITAETPGGTESLPKGDIRVKTGEHGPDHYNLEKVAVVNQIVGREDRGGDMLYSLDLDFYGDVSWDDLEWERVAFSDESVEVINEISNGKLTEYRAEVKVDNKTVGEVSELYVDTDGYQEIEDRYGDDEKRAVTRAAEANARMATLPAIMALESGAIMMKYFHP